MSKQSQQTEQAPLSATDRRHVIDVVSKHGTLRPVFAGRSRVLAVERHVAAHGPRELVIAPIYDYERDRTLVALFDLAGDRVLSVTASRLSFQLSDDERREAEAIAAEDPRVKQFLTRRAMQPLTRLYFRPGSSRHRYALIFLRPNEFERSYAVVDLSSRRVVEVLSRKEFAG